MSKEPICCPKFDPSLWDGKTVTWKSKKFIKGNVITLFYIPLNFGGVITKLMKKIKNAGAKTPDWLCLSDHTSRWNMDLYVAVDKEIPNTTNVQLSGKFFCKVYEGDFKETGNWTNDFEVVVKNKNLAKKKIYLWYTTCPKCAKKYGKNYVAFFAEQ